MLRWAPWKPGCCSSRWEGGEGVSRPGLKLPATRGGGPVQVHLEQGSERACEQGSEYGGIQGGEHGAGARDPGTR